MGNVTVNWNDFGLYTRSHKGQRQGKEPAPRLKAVCVGVVCKLEPRSLIKMNNRSEFWVENTKLEFLSNTKAIYRPA